MHFVESIYQVVSGLERDVKELQNQRQYPAEDDPREMQSLNARIERAFSRLAEEELSHSDLERLQSRIIAVVEQVSKWSDRQVKVRRHEINEEQVRDTFYNVMAAIVTTDSASFKDLKAEDTKVKLTAMTLLQAMKDSAHLKGQILLLNREVLTLENCPRTYGPLAEGILSLKAQIAGNDYEKLFCHLAGKEQEPRLQVLVDKIMTVAQMVAARDAFRKIIGDVMNFCQEGLGVKNQPILHEPSPESLREVTEELVRNTFYELMVDHALTSGCVSKDAVASREAYIYLALSCHALIEVIVQSRTIKGAVPLLSNKHLTLTNCPEAYKPLAPIIFGLKDQICALTDDEVRMLKLSSVDDPNVAVPAELERLKSPALMRIAQNIHSVATEISRLASFKGIIEKVIQFIESAA